MLILAYITSVVFDHAGEGGFNVVFGTSDANYNSNGLFYVNLNGTEGEIEDGIRANVAVTVNAALGTKFGPEDVRLF